MASKLAGMRTQSCPLLTTSLSARVRWDASRRSRLQFLLAPAGVSLGHVIFRKIAAGTSPLAWLRRLALLSRGRTFVGRPFLDTAEMEDSPARMTGPDLGLTLYLACADGTLVVTVVYVLMCPRGDIWGLRFGRSSLSRMCWPWRLLRLLHVRMCLPRNEDGRISL